MKPANPRILTINGGSSSIKFALFEAGDSLRHPLRCSAWRALPIRRSRRAGHGFGNGKLVQITRRFLNSRRWPVDSVELGERLDRKIWNKSSFKHRPMGNSLQDRAVLSVFCVRHICHHFWNALL